MSLGVSYGGRFEVRLECHKCGKHFRPSGGSIKAWKKERYSADKMSNCLNSLPQSTFLCLSSADVMMGVSCKYIENLYKCLYKDAFYSYIQCLGPLRVEMHGGCRQSSVPCLGFVNTTLFLSGLDYFRYQRLVLKDTGSHLVMCCHSNCISMQKMLAVLFPTVTWQVAHCLCAVTGFSDCTGWCELTSIRGDGEEESKYNSLVCVCVCVCVAKGLLNWVCSALFNFSQPQQLLCTLLQSLLSRL